MTAYRRYIKLELLFMCLIIIQPLIIYAHLLFPNAPTMHIGGYEYVSHFLSNVRASFWRILIDFSLILLLSICFFVQKQWWKYALLFILSDTIWRLLSFILIYDLKLITSLNKYNIYIILLIIIPIYIWLDKKVINYQPLTFTEKVELSTKDKLEKLIKFDKVQYLSLQLRLNDLREQKPELSEKEYLYKLIAIKDAMNTL